MNAVVYCRVSSKEQVDGTSLESQETACREYAARNRMTVVGIFIDRGESAKFADRPQLLELISYCAKKEHAVGTLLVWKVDRLARNVGDHFSIKAALRNSNVRVVSVTEPIDANPEGKLLETMLAGFAQFDNDIRAARSVQGMRHKLREGLFPWKAPLGYRSVTRGEKKTRADAPEQPAFGLLQQAWNEFATGNFNKSQLLQMLSTRGLRTERGRMLSPQSLDNILRDPFYAGILRDPWSGEEFSGKHIPMVSRETFEAVQRIIEGRNRSVPHKSVRSELPLRMFVRCGSCESGLTASFSRGRSKVYPYYHCWQPGCSCPGRYRAEDAHREFVSFLRTMSPSPARFSRIKQYVAKLAARESDLDRAIIERRDRELRRIADQQQQLIRMKMECLISDEEFLRTRTALNAQLGELGGKCEAYPINPEELIGILDQICEPLQNLGKVWQAVAIENRMRFQRWALPTGYVYGRVGTAQRGRLFSLLSSSDVSNSSWVPPGVVTLNQLAEDISTISSILIAAADGANEFRPTTVH